MNKSVFIYCKQLLRHRNDFGLLSQCRAISMSSACHEKYKCKMLVVGGGTGGCTIAAKFAPSMGKDQCIVLDPAERHYYQPMFTMIGGGMKHFPESYRAMKSVLPSKAKWMRDAAVNFEPNENRVHTKHGHTITYDVLVIATGLQLNYDKIPGLREALAIPYGNVTSIYSPKYVNRHSQALEKFEKGNIVFTFPASPVKCPGAPQKICYITEHYLRRVNKRQNAKIIYNTALPVIFGVKYFADALWKVVKERNIDVNLNTNLVEVLPDKNIAVFANVEKPSERHNVEYSILHATPPQSAVQSLLEAKDLVNEAGFVNVNKSTLQHIKYANVFAIGDCSSTPNSKTMAAAAVQAGVLEKNIKSHLNGKSLDASYNGYASCPLVTGYNSCIMAEFDYDLKPLETFPIRQDVERYSMFLLKKDFMPFLYWKMMLNGRWNGPEAFRKTFSIFKRN